MEGANDSYQNIKFESASEASGSFQVLFSTGDEEFKGIHGDLGLQDLKSDGIFRHYSESTRFVVIRPPFPLSENVLQLVIPKVVAEAQKLKAQSLEIVLPESIDQTLCGLMAYTINITNYSWDLKTQGSTRSSLNNVVFVHSKGEAYLASDDFRFHYLVSCQQNLSRDLHNTRGNTGTVRYFIEKATQFKIQSGDKVGLKVFHGEKELLDEGLRLIHAVGKGSSEAPALINLTYNGNPDSEEYVAIVGKGVTFDQGGMNSKTAMLEYLFTDKGGASSVFAAFQGIVALGLKINVVCSLAMAENVVSGTAYRPGDIITSHKGLTVEITNTDGEGRLILSDAMSWVQSNYKVDTLIDVATLTGAIVVGIGATYSGIFGNNQQICDQVIAAGKLYSEKHWKMPFCDITDMMMKGKHSDLINYGPVPYGGAIQAASYLKSFVNKDVKYVHLDIAGTSYSLAPMGMFTGKGSKGYACATLLGYIKTRTSQ